MGSLDLFSGRAGRRDIRFDTFWRVEGIIRSISVRPVRLREDDRCPWNRPQDVRHSKKLGLRWSDCYLKMICEDRTDIELQELIVGFIGQLVELEEPCGGCVGLQSDIGELLFAFKWKKVADVAPVEMGDK